CPIHPLKKSLDTCIQVVKQQAIKEICEGYEDVVSGLNISSAYIHPNNI
ncbi:35621_t:CDS:2, partial [Racocetra persica]